MRAQANSFDKFDMANYLVAADYTHTHTHVKAYLRKQIQAIDGDTSLDESERTRRKQVSLYTCTTV